MQKQDLRKDAPQKRRHEERARQQREANNTGEMPNGILVFRGVHPKDSKPIRSLRGGSTLWDPGTL
eukprot:6483301-Amphidinium_carterae.2